MVQLRAMEPEDIDLLLKWENDKSLWHLSNTTKPFSRYNMEQYIINSHLDIYEQKQVRLMIAKEEGNSKTETLGCIDLFDFDPVNLRAGIGLLIDEKFRGKGIAGEALKLIIDYAKNTLNLYQLYCFILNDNTPSKKVFEQAGFVQNGICKEWVRIEKKWHDALFYQIML